MKIIQISTFYEPVTGGVEVQAKEIAEHLKKLSHDVKVFTSDSDRNSKSIEIKQEIINGIEVRRFKTWVSISQFYKIIPGIFFALLDEDFDIVHVHGWRKFEVYAALFAAKLRGKKVVVTTHNPFTVNTRGGLLELAVKVHDWTLGKIFSRFIDKVICLLPSEVEIINKKFSVSKNNIAVIPNGISDIFFEKNIQNSKSQTLNHKDRQIFDNLGIEYKNFDRIVLTASRLNFVKGIQNLKIAADKLPTTLFLIVGGDDGYEAELRNLYVNNKNVIFYNKYVSHSQLRDLYGAADIFVLPSLHEPYGLTPVEAAATGTPVIATNIGGTTEVLSEDAIYFIDPTDQEGLFDEIRTLLSDPVLANEKTLNAKNEANKYKWENVINKLIEVYNQII